MQKYLSIILSLLIVTGVFLYVKNLKESALLTKKVEYNIGSFTTQRSCSRQPNFLKKLRINSPVAIDLSQQNYKGLAFLYGQNLSQAVHLKTWEQFDHFSTYALTAKGDMFLSPMPYISIKKKTFEFQKNIYKLHSNSGKLEVWMSLEDVHAGSNNPYGVISLEYDCDDNSLWVSAIDETDYAHNRGVIYHIDVATKQILQKVEGVDALSLKLIKSERGKFLLYGSARENALYAYEIVQKKLLTKTLKLLDLADTTGRIRKIILSSSNTLKLQTIPFSYSLIAQTQEGSIRQNYVLQWNKELKSWNLLKK